MDVGRKTIFLVDDDATSLTVGANSLDEHYDVITLNSGPRLLRVLEKKKPDMILLDVEMPEMSGYDVIKLLKSNPETLHIPVIFLTGNTDGESELKGLSLGAIDYITKPFSTPLLLKRIEVHLLVESQKNELLNFNNNLMKMVEEKTKTVVELKNAVLKTMAELVERRDSFSSGHIEKTQHYMGIMLDAMQHRGIYEGEVSSWDVKLVLQSAQLHDIGKIAIRDNILMKPSKLTEDEFEQIKKHTVFGEKIIEKIKESTSEQAFLEYAKILAATHHEKWDGSGYPYGLKGHEIPLMGRIMAIVDVYDALLSDRPYKLAFSRNEAINIIRNGKGIHFDPLLVDLFLEVCHEFHEAS